MNGVSAAEDPAIPVGRASLKLFVPLHVLYSAYITGLTEVVLQANQNGAAGTTAIDAAADSPSQEPDAFVVGRASLKCVTYCDMRPVQRIYHRSNRNRPPG
jgi:hypothetical protein